MASIVKVDKLPSLKKSSVLQLFKEPLSSSACKNKIYLPELITTSSKSNSYKSSPKSTSSSSTSNKQQYNNLISIIDSSGNSCNHNHNKPKPPATKPSKQISNIKITNMWDSDDDDDSKFNNNNFKHTNYKHTNYKQNWIDSESKDDKDYEYL